MSLKFYELIISDFFLTSSVCELVPVATEDDMVYSPTFPPGVAVSRSLVWDGATVVVQAFALAVAAPQEATLSYSEVLEVAAVTW